ncbi:glycosyltransferase family 4 protein [Tautonia sp. JC769]|uniref:glycosyltransferase family 4 protein n=1 Tax=Tautonia sp. JC769 TaxID=3232135 RepID=UPI003458E02A
MTTILHLTASTFLGGPEHQMLGLSRALPENYRSVIASFREGGRCHPFLQAASNCGLEAVELKLDTPRFGSSVGEISSLMRKLEVDIICTHGYKSNVLGYLSCKKIGIPIISVSHGWTSESVRVRFYESLDRRMLRFMDQVVCVSKGQALKVRRSGVPDERIAVIHDAIQADRFSSNDPSYRDRLRDLFGRAPGTIVGAAGRLSPEKGFEIFVEASALVARTDPEARFVLFGGGRLEADLRKRVIANGLADSFVLAGFRDDFDRYLPYLDILVLPSYTEGLPNVVLEAFAAKVPVVATSVGGTPEAVDDGVNGFLVLPGDPASLANRILELVTNAETRQIMGVAGYKRALKVFAFELQAERYDEIFRKILRQST